MYDFDRTLLVGHLKQTHPHLKEHNLFAAKISKSWHFVLCTIFDPWFIKQQHAMQAQT